MTIHHHIPPASRRAGGLETAVQGLHRALIEGGVVSTLVERGSARQLPPDVAHFHGMWDIRHWWAARRMRQQGIITVVSPHGMLEPWALRRHRWKKQPFFHLFEKHRLNSSDAVLATSEMERQHLQSLVPQARLTVLPLGLEVPAEVSSPGFRAASRRSLGLADTVPMVLFLSRIDVKKGIDLLLEAWRALVPIVQERKAVLYVVGGGGESPFEHRCRELAARCNTAGAPVYWMGSVWGEERWKYFAAADLFCLPSHSENFGFVVPEAWFCGTPVLTTTRTPWSGQRGREGLLLCEPEQDPLRDALDGWLATASTAGPARASIAASAREQHSWDALTPDYLDFYGSLRHGRPDRSATP